jgi:O-antigen ligase
MARFLPWATGAVVLAMLVPLAGQGIVFGLVALTLAAAGTAILALGPDRAGALALIAAFFTAPWNDVRPTEALPVVTLSDVFLAFGLVLLVPQLVARRPRMPLLYWSGAVVLVLMGMLSSFLAPSPVESLAVLSRLVIAAIMLPIAIATWGPSAKMVDALAWAYIAGQTVSTIAALFDPTGDAYERAAGFATHPNFLGLGAQMGLALLLYLLHRVDRSWRWLVYLAGVVMFYSVSLSGSRGSLLVMLLLLAVYPLVERTALSWYVVLTIGALALIGGNWVIASAAPGSALGRLRGEGSAMGSDQERQDSLSMGLHQFLDRPLTGSGWHDKILEIHNAYVEVAVAGGVIALLAYLFVMLALTRPLVSARHRNRMAYTAMSFAAIGLIDPYLWERIAWLALALVFAVPKVEAPLAGEPAPSQAPHPQEVR